MLMGLALALAAAGFAVTADLSSSDWRPSFLSASELPARDHMVIRFDANGTVSGNGGCNMFHGAYSTAGNQIEIGPIAATRKGCPGLIESETAFFAALRAAKSFTQDGDTLILFDADGSKLAEFLRSD